MVPPASTTVPETSVIDIDMPGSVVGVWVSCAEIYNEFIYDLFTEVPTGKRAKEKGPRPVLRCAEDSSSNVFIKGTDTLRPCWTGLDWNIPFSQQMYYAVL